MGPGLRLIATRTANGARGRRAETGGRLDRREGAGPGADFRGGIGHPKLVTLYDYWHGLRGDRDMPLRRLFDPLHIPALLPNILLNEVVGRPPRFRIRVEGSAVSAARGFDATGKFLDDEGVAVLDDGIFAAYAAMVLDRKPWYSTGAFTADSGRAGDLYRLALPLSAEGHRVDFILVGFFHELRRL